MQAVEDEMMRPVAEEELLAMFHELPFETAQGWMLSTSYIAQYLEEHTDHGMGLSSNQAAMMGAGRLHWLLRQSRPTLSGLFSESDVVILMECYQGSIFFPGQIEEVRDDLCDHLGMEPCELAGSGIDVLIETLGGLSPVQLMTLADALEQTWYRGLDSKAKSPKGFLGSIGIVLK